MKDTSRLFKEILYPFGLDTNTKKKKWKSEHKFATYFVNSLVKFRLDCR